MMMAPTRALDAALIDSLAQAIETKDPATYQHSRDVQRYCAEIALELKWDEVAQSAASVAGLLHDIGKVTLAEAILRKPAALTDAEYEQMKQHPAAGAETVAAVPGLERIAESIRYHHERWNGTGYPEGITGNRIPRLARLIAVAETFSVLTSDQPYRKAVTEAEAFSVLEQGAGTQWDIAIVAALGRILEKNATL